MCNLEVYIIFAILVLTKFINCRLIYVDMLIKSRVFQIALMTGGKFPQLGGMRNCAGGDFSTGCLKSEEECF